MAHHRRSDATPGVAPRARLRDGGPGGSRRRRGRMAVRVAGLVSAVLFAGVAVDGGTAQAAPASTSAPASAAPVTPAPTDGLPTAAPGATPAREASEAGRVPGPAATDVPTASPAPAAETRAAGAFDCTPGYVYTAAEDGAIKQVSSTNAVTTPVTAPGSGAGDSRTWTSDTRKWGTGLLTKTWGMGPFGIGAGGTKAYSLERGNAATADTNYGIPSLQGLNVTRSFNYDQEVLLANKWSAQWFATRDTKGNRPLAAGAVVPTGKDAGQLYFGSFEASGTVGGAMSFRLSSYKPGGLNGAWRTIGTIPLPDFASDATTGNPESDYFAGSRGLEGDIAFDAAGNMYILASTQPKVNPNMPGGRSIKVQLITVPANSLMPIANRAVEIPVPAGASGTGLTGMATSADGTLFVSDATSVGGSAPGSRLSDLASCSLPPTLTVTENLPQGRNLPTDQFSVAVHKGDATATSLTTSGTATGVQPQTAGPLMVLSTQAVTLTQTMPSGDPIGYLTTWQCTGTTSDTSSGTGPVATVYVLAGTAASCQFTNVPNLGKLTTTKDFPQPHYGAPTDPTAWTLRAISRQAFMANPNAAWTDFTSGQTRSLGAQTYLLDEAPQPGYELTGITCTPLGGTAQTLRREPVDPARPELGEAYQWSLAAGQQVTCQLHNSVQPGTLTWTKTSQSSDLLAGSGWQLTAPGGAQLAVVDNTGQPGYAGADTDPTPGRFVVTNQPWGSHRLVETEAPSGHALAQGSTELTVTATHLAPSVAIANDPLVFHLQKSGYAHPGAAEPTPMDGADYEIRLDDGGRPGGLVPGVVVNPTAGVGRFDVTGLPTGNFWLVETRSLPGHALLPAAVPFTVVSGTTALPLGRIDTPRQELTWASADGFTLHVRDERAVQLPWAGGSTSPLTYVLAGLAIIATASAAGAMRSRLSHPAAASPGDPLSDKEMR
ncbi:surface-anchored fimbrial subunit [Propionibacterium freudenreichii]|uniref:MSCRAMM family protein n=3 Tax=Propionibacterium freudenreichii TaxID=1744 RepID=UPI0005A5CB6D|nr:hypothetical protein [Propionibacterium freudenreichii]CEI27748.1 surface-anchored fimbrial subunit [Propionibacterium freudenreichii]